jgi:uncharacterized protein YbaR (Trm112 family)
MCGDLLLKFLKLYQKFRVLTERLLINQEDGLAYPVVDGIPLLLPAEAKKIV